MDHNETNRSFHLASTNIKCNQIYIQPFHFTGTSLSDLVSEGGFAYIPAILYIVGSFDCYTDKKCFTLRIVKAETSC